MKNGGSINLAYTKKINFNKIMLIMNLIIS